MNAQNFAITILLLFGSIPAFAAKREPITLSLEYSQYGKPVCAGEKIVRAGEQSLVCESEEAGKRTRVRVTAELKPLSKEAQATDVRRQVQLSIAVEEAQANGKMKRTGSPRMIVLEGEPAEMSDSELLKDGSTREKSRVKVLSAMRVR